MPQKRFLGIPAVLASGVCAGTMESSRGSANVTPTPRKNVRRGRCFFVMNAVMVCLSLIHCSVRGHDRRRNALRRFFYAHLKGRAVHDTENQIRHPEVAGL